MFKLPIDRNKNQFNYSFLAVEKMRSGASPQKAAQIAIMVIDYIYVMIKL
jgi:hypothetical protein